MLSFIRKLERQKWRRDIAKCFDDVGWARQRFLISGVLVKVDGEDTFYKAAEIDDAIERLNKVLEKFPDGDE